MSFIANDRILIYRLNCTNKKEMFKDLKKIFIYISLFIIVAFAIFVVNQVASVTALAYGVNPVFGFITLLLLVATLGTLLAIPVIAYYRLPAALMPPEDMNSEAYTQYLAEMKKRLNKNPYIVESGLNIVTDADIQKAFAILDTKANDLIKATASTVFLSTAISQNGRLDAIMVLMAQMKLVWQITHLYFQRPSLKQMTTLYANIAGTTFIASELDDMNLARYIEPGLSTILGTSVLKMVPGAQVAAGIITNSIIEGTANSFLTLRVGVITRRYCTSLEREEKWSLRKSASLEAAKMLGDIAVRCANLVSNSIIEATKSFGVGTVKNSGSMIYEASKKTFSVFKNVGDKILKEAGFDVEANPTQLLPNGQPI